MLSTIILYYATLLTCVQFNVVITATQDSVTRQLTLNESRMNASLPAVDVSTARAYYI